MIIVTEQAAQQIQKSIDQSNVDGMGLRIAAQSANDGSIEYMMGFDNAKEDDTTVVFYNIEFIIKKDLKDLLEDTKLDYVEINDGEFQFVFLNPNDPYYKPPKEDKKENKN